MHKAQSLSITLCLSKAVHVFIYIGFDSKAILNPFFGFLAVRRQDIKPRERLSEPQYNEEKARAHLDPFAH